MFRFPAPVSVVANEDLNHVLIEGTAGLVGAFSVKFQETYTDKEKYPKVLRLDSTYRATIILILLYTEDDNGKRTSVLPSVLEDYNHHLSMQSEAIETEGIPSVVTATEKKPLPTYDSSSLPVNILEDLSTEEWVAVVSWFASKMPDRIVNEYFELIRVNRLWKTVGEPESKNL
jgi:hypothetical protein